MAAPAELLYSAEYIWSAPQDGLRYEVINGKLYVTTSPDWIHQLASANLHFALLAYVRPRRLGYVVAAPTGVILAPRVGVQPDLVFVSAGRSDIITTRGVEGTPDLVVEILSPGTRATDRRVKRSVYAAAGVPHYWVLDPRTHSLEAHVLSEGAGDYESAGVFRPGSVFRPQLFPDLEIVIDDLWR